MHRLWWFLGLSALASTVTGGHVQASETVTIAVASYGNLAYLPLDIAQAKGFFREEGLDVRLSYVKGGGTQAAVALIGGSADFSGNGIDHAIKAAARGKSLKMLAVFTELPGMALVVSSEHRSTIRSIADLRGRRLGVTSPGSSSHMFLNYLLLRHGVPSDAVEVVGAGAETFPAALKAKRIDAGMVGSPFSNILLDAGDAYPLADLTSRSATLEIFGGLYYATGLLTRADVIAARPEICQKVVNAVVKAMRWVATTDAEGVANALPKDAVSNRDLFLRALAGNRDVLSRDGRIEPGGVETAIRIHRETGLLPAEMPLDPAALIDSRFVSRAQASR